MHRPERELFLLLNFWLVLRNWICQHDYHAVDIYQKIGNTIELLRKSKNVLGIICLWRNSIFVMEKSHFN